VQEISSMPIHMADLGSDNYEQEFTLSLMENDEGTLDLIELAWSVSRTEPMASAKSAASRFPRPGSMRCPMPRCASSAPAIRNAVRAAVYQRRSEWRQGCHGLAAAVGPPFAECLSADNPCGGQHGLSADWMQGDGALRAAANPWHPEPSAFAGSVSQTHRATRNPRLEAGR